MWTPIYCMCGVKEKLPQVYSALKLVIFFLWPLLAHLSHCSCLFKKQYFLFAAFIGEGSNLFLCSLLPHLSPFCSLIAPSLLFPSLRMKLWRRSAWPLQVAFLVALVMLCVDPVSAGNRNHRGPTGTPGLALSPPLQHHKRLITLSLQRYNTCSLRRLLTEPSQSRRRGLSRDNLLCPSVWQNVI